MKKILGFLFILFCASGLQAKPENSLHKMWRVQPVAQQQLVNNLRFSPTIDFNKEDAYGNTLVFAAALKGDVRGLAWLQQVAPNGEYLLHTGKDGNNVLHVARDMKTFKALLRSLRHFYPQDFEARFQQLLEQKNDLRETPLRAQLNYGKADIFVKYFPKTRLFARMQRIQAKLSRGGLLAEVAQDEKQDILEKTKDLSGLTLPQAVRRVSRQPGMKEVSRLFDENFSLL
ncbi:hypothetical protein [Candidatus Avelusimicrobium aviculae]|uniref:hypothetical protein n=1 Tax=Candidatus Avelusimicrobium aviculae TaxID=3416206 RepID=UPI003D0C75DC